MHGISGRRSGTQRHPDLVQRVVVLGPGGPGKTTAAKQLGRLLQVPVFELDEMFWSTDLAPTPPQRWASLQFQLAVADRWVMDGDLGPMTSSNRGWPARTPSSSTSGSSDVCGERPAGRGSVWTSGGG